MPRGAFVTPVRIFRLKSGELGLVAGDGSRLAYSSNSQVTDAGDLAELKELGVKDAGAAPENKDASRKDTENKDTPVLVPVKRSEIAESLAESRSRPDLLDLATEEEIDISQFPGNVSKAAVAEAIVAKRAGLTVDEAFGGSDSEDA